MNVTTTLYLGVILSNLFTANLSCLSNKDIILTIQLHETGDWFIQFTGHAKELEKKSFFNLEAIMTVWIGFAIDQIWINFWGKKDICIFYRPIGLLA